MKFTTGIPFAAVASYTSLTSATTSSYCPNNQKACYRWAVADTAANGGTGDVYFQIKAPTSYQWVGLGTGSEMKGSDMFIIYTDGSGNVTLSTRSGQGEFMPEYTRRDKVQLLEGSGVSSGNMIANIRCSDCTGMDTTGTNPFIAAWKQGSALDALSTSQNINEHDDYTNFHVDFKSASLNGTSSTNPFADAGSSGNTGVVLGGPDSGGGGGNNGVISRAHGIIMSIVFVIAYPVGAMIMPLIGKWLIHAGWQIIAFLAMWAGLGLGVVLSKINSNWGSTHTILGVVVSALLIVQPLLGWAHHRHFVKHRQRGIISCAHIWYGRILIILGIVNGGLGLALAGAESRYIIAYAVVSPIVALLYLATIFVGRRKRQLEVRQDEKDHSSDDRQTHTDTDNDILLGRFG